MNISKVFATALSQLLELSIDCEFTKEGVDLEQTMGSTLFRIESVALVC